MNAEHSDLFQKKRSSARSEMLPILPSNAAMPATSNKRKQAQLDPLYQ
jgi:hypothetical protein